jgi:CDP-4-dehydro-6-deoxyglucose reductase
MPDTLPLSRAARAAGVSRKELQSKIEAGELRSFEGMVLMDELFDVFPPARFKESAQIERMQAIKDAALHKAMPDDSPSEFAHLLLTVEHLEVELARARSQAEDYRRIIDTMVEKIEEVQGECDQRQRILLGTLLSWMLTRLDDAGSRGPGG